MKPRSGTYTHTSRRTRSSHAKGEAVGFYGCNNGVVRIEFAPGHAPDHAFYRPQRLELPCPACGHTHDFQPLWRRKTKRDAGKTPDIILRRQHGGGWVREGVPA